MENEFKSQAIQKKIKVVYNSPISTPSVSTNKQDEQQVKNQRIVSTNNVNQSEQKLSDKQVTPGKENILEDDVKNTEVNNKNNGLETVSPATEPQQDVTAKISPSAMLFITIIVLVLGWLYY